MHLTECVDLFSETNSFDPEVRLCLKNWLWKTKTEFHGDDLSELMGPVFAGLCFSYTLGGLSMLFMRPKWYRECSFPWIFNGVLLAAVQGPISFLADYVNMCNDSVWHVIDRFLALSNLGITFWKLSALYKYARPSRFYFEIASITFAIVCFILSQDAQEARDKESFVFFHNLWHCYPFACILIHTVDEVILDGYSYKAAMKTRMERPAVSFQMKTIITCDKVITKPKVI